MNKSAAGKRGSDGKRLWGGSRTGGKNGPEEGIRTEGIDTVIRLILAGQVLLSALFLFLLSLFPAGVWWLAGGFAVLECILVFRGFLWLSGYVNKSLCLANDCVQELIDGHWEEGRRRIYFDSREDTLTGKLQNQIYKLYEIMKSHEEQEQELKMKLSGLVADLVHQMNTPLTNIRMYCDFLLMPDLEEYNRKQFLDNIAKQAEKLGWFGEGFEKAARLETDMITVQPRNQPLFPILLEAIGQAAPKAERRGKEIRLEGERDIRARVDGKWTLEAVFNLLDNAVKYGEEGREILLRMSVYDLYACIEVCSEGSRIQEEERNAVFQRFYRGKQAAMLQEGVGLGLFLTRKIITDQGGYVSVSDYGENGNCFRIYVRREDVP